VRWRRPVLAGAAIDSPSERRRPTMVLSTVSRARDSTSDAPCRAQLLPRKTPGVRQEPDPISSTPRQSRRLLRIRAPSIDECSLARARHRSHGFAAARRLPKPVHPSCAARFPTWCLEARPFASPRGPGSVRRFLQSNTIREHALRTFRSPESSARLPTPSPAGWAHAASMPQVRRPGAGRRDPSRGFTGQGPRLAHASRAPLV